MKKVIIKKKIALSVMLFSYVFLITSCKKDNVDPASNKAEISSSKKTEAILTKAQTRALMLNGINPINSEVAKLTTEILGERVNGVTVDDYFFSYKQLDQMVSPKNNAKLFASTNRITLPSFGKRTIRIGGVRDGDDKLSSSLLTALQSAILKYNLLNMSKLNLRFSSITQAEANNRANFLGPIDIIVFVDSDDNFVGNADGRATFPNNGDPGLWVGLDVNTANYSQKNNTLLIMHELGHTLGMAHADFLTRSSCGNTTTLDEDLGDLLGLPNVTEVCNVAGTDDSGDFTNSVMRACGFFSFTTASFTAEDRSAFKTLYSQVDMPCEETTTVDPNPFCTPQSASWVQNLSPSTLQQLIATGVVCP